MKGSRKRAILSSILLGALILLPSGLAIHGDVSATYVQLGASQAQSPSVGIFAQVSGLFDQTYTPTMMTKFYNVVFGTGVFNSMEVFTPLGMSYSNTVTDTQYTQQITQLAQLSEQNSANIKMVLLVGMALQSAYNESGHEWTQLVNFIQATHQYPEVYALGINWERDTWSCDAFTSTCGQGTATAAQISQAAMNIQILAQCYGKQFISYYSSSVKGVAPVSKTANCPNGGTTNIGSTWLNIFNTGYPVSCSATLCPNGDAYWTVGGAASNIAPWNYVGISNGLFTGFAMPAPLQYASSVGATGAGDLVSVCTLTAYNGNCGPVGQWNNVTVDWLLQQTQSLYNQHPSQYQFVMLGGDRISGSYSAVDPTLPSRFWNSLDFQNWVRNAEQKYGLVPLASSPTTSLMSTMVSNSTTTSTTAATSSVTSSSSSTTKTSESHSSITTTSTTSSATITTLSTSSVSSTTQQSSTQTAPQVTTTLTNPTSTTATTTATTAIVSSSTSSTAVTSQTSGNTTSTATSSTTTTHTKKTTSVIQSRSGVGHQTTKSDKISGPSTDLALVQARSANAVGYAMITYEIVLIGGATLLLPFARKIGKRNSSDSS